MPDKVTVKTWSNRRAITRMLPKNRTAFIYFPATTV
jgi:hypothetical protein